MSEVLYDQSPYSWTLNNPLVFTDPTGMLPKYNWDTGEYEDDDGNTVTFEQTMAAHNIDLGNGNKNNDPESEGEESTEGAQNPISGDTGGDGSYNALLARAKDGGTYAGYGSGVLGVGQIGMLEYRQSLTINSKIGTFGRFSRTYSGLGVASRTLGKAGTYVGAPLSVYLDYGAMQAGQISGERFTYRTVGTGSSVVGGIMIGSSFGGPWGAAGGALIGGAFVAGEIAYDAGVWLWNETSRQIYNFKEGLKGGWYPGR